MRQECIDCGNHCDAQHPCMTGAGIPGGIMIIGDSPTYNEDDTMTLFSGAVGNWLYRELLKVGVDMNKCYLTKAIKCYSPNTPIRKTVIKSCRQLLIEEVRTVKPEYILVLGSTALDVMTGKTGIAKLHGQMFWWGGAKVIPTFHPSAVINQPKNAWEFRSDINYFSRMCEGNWQPPDDFNWMIVDDEFKLANLLNDINTSDIISYDIETTGLIDKIKTGKLLMIGIATPNMCYLIAWEIKYSTFTPSRIVKILNEILGKNTIKKVAQNAKFDNRWLRSRGVEPFVDFDTYLASYLVNVVVPHGLKYMAKTYLGAADYNEGIEFKENLTQEEFEAMAKYCCLDVYYTLRLEPILRTELIKG